jgi:SRSO17 transposase
MLKEVFRVRTRDESLHAQDYLAGLLSRCQRKNMERFGEDLPGVQYEDLQHFLSDSPWDERALWRWTGLEAARLLDGGLDNALLIDESAFAKKGEKSAGVGRQHNGRLGKVENSQVGVFSVLSRGKRAALTGGRLYLPEDWVKDPRRCKAAGIPKSEQKFRTKNELAWELIEQAEADGVAFGWLGMDAAYGRDQGLLLKIVALGKSFVADVDFDQQVWTECPPGPCRPRNLKESGTQRVDALWEQGKKSSRSIQIRSGENGRVRVKFWARRVWIWPPTSEIPFELWLLVSEARDGKVKYSLCHSLQDLGWEELAARQGQRYFVERAFEDGKSELGMADYQVRKWKGWHHHMALVGAAMVFALGERQRVGHASPLTSVRDVVEMVAWYFEAERTPDQIEEVIQMRHLRRKRAMESKERRDANL